MNCTSINMRWLHCILFILSLVSSTRWKPLAASFDRRRILSLMDRSSTSIKNEVPLVRGGTVSKQSSRTSIASTRDGRRACRLYVWDAPSAFFSVWCNRLQRDCVYEGRGGKKFVRIQPGSILQMISPCSRHSADRCVCCGGNFRDHLHLWWFKNLYTPFDRLADQIYRESVLSESRIPGSTTRQSYKLDAPHHRFGFHRRYVLDISQDVAGGSQGQTRDQTSLIRQSIAKHFGNVPMDHIEQRVSSMTFRGDQNFPEQTPITYAVLRPTSYKKYLVETKPTTVIAWLLVRELFLSAVERVMQLEAMDRKNEWISLRRH